MRIALLSTSDTDLLSARESGADYVLANPARPGHQSMAEVIGGCDLVVGRLLGSPQELCSGFTRVAATRAKPEQRSCGEPRSRPTTRSQPSITSAIDWCPGRAGLART